MNSLEELYQELNKLSNGDFVKINIHYNINGALLTLCERINRDINEYAFGLIRFGAKSISIPHISVFMGYINSFSQFELLFQKVSDYADQAKAFRIDPTQLYLKSIAKTSPKYLFLDLLQKQELMEHKKYFSDLFANQVKPIEWDFLNESPHITLGCYKAMSQMVIKRIEGYHEFPCCQIKDIGISISGRKGICLGNLKSFELIDN